MPEPKYQPPEEQGKHQRSMMDLIRNNLKAVVAGGLAVVLVLVIVLAVVLVPGGPVTPVQKGVAILT